MLLPHLETAWQDIAQEKVTIPLSIISSCLSAVVIPSLCFRPVHSPRTPLAQPPGKY